MLGGVRNIGKSRCYVCYVVFWETYQALCLRFCGLNVLDTFGVKVKGPYMIAQHRWIFFCTVYLIYSDVENIYTLDAFGTIGCAILGVLKMKLLLVFLGCYISNKMKV